MVSRTWYIFAPIASLAVGAVLAPSEPVRSACAAATQWVEAHRGALPVSYREFSGFAPAYRRAIYVKLPHAVRLAFWQAHLHRLVVGSQLDGEQLEFVREVIVGLPAYIDNQEGVEPILGDSLMVRARAMFGDSLSQAAFVDLGIGVQRGEKLFGGEIPDCDCDGTTNCGDLMHCQFSDCNGVTGRPWTGICVFNSGNVRK